MKTVYTIASMISAAVLGATTAFAQGDEITREDKEFLKNASEMGITEVELGKLAMERGSNEEVKAFGKKMMSDHKMANERLEKLAKKKKVELKMESTSAQKQMLSAFEKKSGAEFDKEFWEHVAKDHESAIKTFQDAAKDAKDADVKAFAEETLPALKKHHSSVKK